MASAYEQSVTKFRDRLLRVDATAMQAVTDAYAPIRTDLLKQIADLEKVLPEAQTPRDLYKLNRYKRLIAQIEAQTGQLVQDAGAVIRDGQAGLVSIAQDETKALATVQAGQAGAKLAANVSESWTMLNHQALVDLVGRLSDGSPLREYLDALPESYGKVISDELVKGIALGKHPRAISQDLTARLDGQVARLLTTTRTAMLDSYRSASLRSMAENGDILDGWQWQAAHDRRTCLACFPAGTLVSGPGAEKVFSRHYAGDIIVIETASGEELTATPNHPILTDIGWVSAGSLDESRYVLRCPSLQDASSGLIGVDDYCAPTPIEQVAESFPMVSLEMPCAAPDFHGDGVGSDVYVVRTNGLLGNQINTGILEHREQFPFIDRVVDTSSILSSALPVEGRSDALVQTLEIGSWMIDHGAWPGLEWNCGTAQRDRILKGAERGLAHLEACVDRLPRHADSFCDSQNSLARLVALGHQGVVESNGAMLSVGGQSERNGIFSTTHQSTPVQDPEQPLVVDPADARRVLSALAGEIRGDRVVKVFRRTFSGQVYNLQTKTGWYLANGIIVHNCLALDGTIHPVTETFMGSHAGCRCSPRPVVTGGLPSTRETGQQWFDRQSESVQNSMLPVYAQDAYRSGKVTLNDFVQLDKDPRWGDRYRQGSVRENIGSVQTDARQSRTKTPQTITDAFDELPLVDREKWNMGEADTPERIAHIAGNWDKIPDGRVLGQRYDGRGNRRDVTEKQLRREALKWYTEPYADRNYETIRRSIQYKAGGQLDWNRGDAGGNHAWSIAHGVATAKPINKPLYRGSFTRSKTPPDSLGSIGDRIKISGTTSFSADKGIADGFRTGTVSGSGKHLDKKLPYHETSIVILPGAKGIPIDALTVWNQGEVITGGEFEIVDVLTETGKRSNGKTYQHTTYTIKQIAVWEPPVDPPGGW